MPDHALAIRLKALEELETMLRDNETVMISLERAALDEGETQKVKQSAYFVVETSARRPRGISLILPDAIIDVGKNPPHKVCLTPTCHSKGSPQPLAMFGADKDSRDGHSSECRACAAKRINAIGKRKKGQR